MSHLVVRWPPASASGLAPQGCRDARGGGTGVSAVVAQPCGSAVGAPPLVERGDIVVGCTDVAQYVFGVRGPDDLGTVLVGPARHRSRVGGGALMPCGW